MFLKSQLRIRWPLAVVYLFQATSPSVGYPSNPGCQILSRGAFGEQDPADRLLDSLTLERSKPHTSKAIQNGYLHDKGICRSQARGTARPWHQPGHQGRSRVLWTQQVRDSASLSSEWRIAQCLRLRCRRGEYESALLRFCLRLQGSVAWTSVRGIRAIIPERRVPRR